LYRKGVKGVRDFFKHFQCQISVMNNIKTRSCTCPKGKPQVNEIEKL